MDCAYNVSQLIDKYLIENSFSYNVSQECSTCKWTDNKNIKVLEINPKPIYENSIRGLQIAVNQRIEETNKKCKRCANENLITNFVRGPHLFIDLECLQWSDLASKLGYSDWSGMLTLSEIPLDIQSCNSTYKLVAAIEYIGGTNKNDIGHYIAHCRRVTGNWEVYDDLNKNKTSLTASSRMLLLQKKKISLLIFIKQ